MTTRTILIAIFCSLMAGCGSSNRQHSVGMIPAPVKTIKLIEDLRFGNDEESPSLLLDRIDDVAVGPDGMIYVADRGATTVVVVNAAGEFVRNIGSRGQGPGEFEFLSSISLSGDSIFVWIPFKGPSVFDRESGSYLNQYRFPDVGSYAIGGVFAQDGEFFLSNANDGRVSGGPNKLLRFTLGDAAAETVMTLPATELLKGTDGSITFPDYLKQSFCTATGGNVYCGFNDKLQFSVVSVGGDSVGVVNVEFEPQRISPTKQAEWVDEYAGTPFTQNLDIPEHWPAFSSIVGDDAGRLWIALHQTGNDETTIWIVDPDKQVSSMAVVDGGLKVYACSKGKLYGVQTDSEGDRAVVRYAIEE